MVVIRDSLVASQTEYCHRNGEEVLTVMLSTLGHGYKTVYIMVFVMMMMMMMSGFVERVINSPQTRYRSAKQLSSERQRGESCGLQSGWYTVPDDWACDRETRLLSFITCLLCSLSRQHVMMFVL